VLVFIEEVIMSELIKELTDIIMHNDKNITFVLAQEKAMRQFDYLKQSIQVMKQGLKAEFDLPIEYIDKLFDPDPQLDDPFANPFGSDVQEESFYLTPEELLTELQSMSITSAQKVKKGSLVSFIFECMEERNQERQEKLAIKKEKERVAARVKAKKMAKKKENVWKAFVDEKEQQLNERKNVKHTRAQAERYARFELWINRIRKETKEDYLSPEHYHEVEKFLTSVIRKYVKNNKTDIRLAQKDLKELGFRELPDVKPYK
jgi:hypothetical protein